MDIIEIAKECGALGFNTLEFTRAGLQQFAQRIEAPHKQRIAELEALVKGYREDFEILSTTESATLRNRTKQIEQLREALSLLLDCAIHGYDMPEDHSYAIISRNALEETK